MIKKRLKTAFLFAAIMFFTASYCQKDSKSSSSLTGENLIKMIDSADALKKIIDSSGNRLIVLDLYADWCLPCKLLSPMLSEIAGELKGKADFYQINLEKNPEIAKIFNVTGIPLVIIIKNKTAVQAIQGLAPKSEYIRTINSYINNPAGQNDTAPDGKTINGIPEKKERR